MVVKTLNIKYIRIFKTIAIKKRVLKTDGSILFIILVYFKVKIFLNII